MIIILLGIAAYVYVFIANDIDETSLNKIVQEIEWDTYLVNSVSIEKEEKKNHRDKEKENVYPYNVVIYSGENFDNLSGKEKLKFFEKVKGIIKSYSETNDSFIFCGKEKLCEIEEIYVRGEGSKSYTLVFNNTEMNYSYFDGSNRIEKIINEENATSATPTTTTPTTTSNPTENSKPQLEILDKNATIDGDFIYTTGAVKNNSSSSYTFIQVKVTHADEKGNVIDTDTTYVNSSDTLRPNEQKYFEIMTRVRNSNYKKYRIEIIDFNID